MKPRRTGLLVAFALVAAVIGGCSGSGSGSISTSAQGGKVTIVCGGGGVKWGNGAGTLTGLTITGENGVKLKRVKVIIFIDRNGDGIPDATEIKDQEEHIWSDGAVSWVCGTLSASWARDEPMPKIYVEGETTEGKFKKTHGPSVLPSMAPEIKDGGGSGGVPR